jgi:PAS domain S-box-containing protein
VALLEVSRVATVTLDPEAKVTSWNPAAEELFGYSSEEAVGRKLAELVAATPELQAEAIRLTERAAREGRTQAVTRGTHKDGTVVDVEVVAASVVSDGEHLGHIAIYRDVSEHRRAEEERRRAENRYLDLIERLPLTVYIDRLDDVSSNVYTSPHLESVLGYTAEEWTSDDELFLKVVHPDDRERVLAEHVRTRETGEQFKTEYRMIAKDGTVRWFLDQARVVADDRTGLPAYHQGFLLEITERKELEEALKRSEAELRRQKQYFESLLEISPTAVVTVDLQDKVSSWNPAAERLFGYSKAEAIGRSIDELVADSDEVRAEAVAHSDQARVGRVQAVTRRTRKDGALVDVELLAVPLTLDGELAGSYAIYHDIGALKQAAEAQREAEKRYRDLIEHVPLVTYIDEPSETAPNIYTSPQVEALVGTPPDEWVGDPDFFPKLLHPDDRERVIADHGRALSSGASSWSFEYRLLARDGRTVWIRDDAVVVKDERGQPLYTQGFMLDITERKHAEEALRRSEVEVRRQKQYYQTLLEISPAAVVTMDLEERVTSWNPAAERLFGYTQDEAVGELIDELVLRREDLVEEGVAVSREAAEQGAAHLIARRVRKDGTLVDVEVLMAPLVVGGEQVGWNVIYHDISELQRQKQFLESLLDISPVATVTIDLEDKISSWNPAAQRLFGYSKAEAIGANIDDLIAGPEELQAEAAGYAEAARRGPLRAITRRSRKDGTLVDVVLLATPVIVEDETIGHLAVYHDISELQRAREEAEAATHAKSVFLATMSHEIRTPMNAVIGMTDLLLETELDQEQRDFVEVVRTSGDVLLRVIDDVLDFSKIESGKLELERRPFELRECVESALELVATQAAERDLELGCLIDSDVPPEITGDAARLRQVLLNLVGNAVKFTEEGEVVVVVRREGSAPGGHRLHVAVRDTGIGIPEERMSELFQSFSQVDASTSRRFGGTGLGLAISKRLSELMGGTMWAESAPGQGSTFHFTFVAAEAPVTAPPHAGGDQPQLHAKRLLVVDDNATNREIVVRQARSWGMLPRATGRPSEALTWVERGDPFDVAILDMQMPEIDGLALARRIRGQPAGRALPLVLLTSLGRKERSWAREFAVTLTKPVRASQLYDALVGILARRPEERKEPEARVKVGPVAAAAPARSGLRILVAEDNGVNQKLALGLLGKLGYEADVAGNGAEALEAVEGESYDVVLMDVQMPELDGLEATRRIRRRRPHGPPRIIAMTANALQEDREACFAAGMDDYLAKPLRVAQLADALTRAEPVEEAPPLASGALEALRDQFGDEAFVQDLLDTFLQEAPRLVANLRSGSAEEARRAAHTLKTNARTLGAAELGRVCEELEELAKQDRLEGASARVARADAEYARVERAVRAAR